MRLIEIGNRVYASLIIPGMIIELPNGERFDVGEVREGYDTFTFISDGGYDSAKVDYAERLKVIGYFNPA